MGGAMEVVVEDGWDNHDDDKNITQSERERRPELKPDWHEVK